MGRSAFLAEYGFSGARRGRCDPVYPSRLSGSCQRCVTVIRFLAIPQGQFWESRAFEQVQTLRSDLAALPGSTPFHLNVEGEGHDADADLS